MVQLSSIQNLSPRHCLQICRTFTELELNDTQVLLQLLEALLKRDQAAYLFHLPLWAASKSLTEKGGKLIRQLFLTEKGGRLIN